MKLVCSLPSFSILKDIASFMDGILLEDTDDILERIHSIEEAGLLPIYKLNEMVFPFQMDTYKKKILSTRNTNCLYYITDIGLAYVLKQLGCIHRTIFDPITMITNHLDAKEYMHYGFEAIGISNEITIKDTISIINRSHCKAFLQVFGYRQMLSTRRRLITLYKQKNAKSFPLEKIVLQEETRKEQYPIIENVHGTKMYRDSLISLFQEFRDMPLEYAYLEGFNIQKDCFIEVAKLFFGVKNGGDISCAIQTLEKLNLSIDDGFSYQDSIYVKEDF